MRAETRAPAFVGRDAEREALRALLADAARGRLRFALVSGEAGIGKTRLVDEALAGHGALRVFPAKCDEYEQRRAFAPLASALGCRAGAPDEARARIGAALGGSSAEGPAHFELLEHFLALIEAEALSGRAALVLDDVQWSDEATASVLRALPRRLSYIPLAAIVIHRPVPAATPRGRLFAALADEGGTRITLGPLSPDDVGRLAEASVGAPPHESLDRFLSGAAGNPLFVHELLAALRREGSVRVEGGGAVLADASLPPDLRLTIVRRISYLPDEALEVLRTASILGSTFDPRDLAAVVGAPARALARALEPCIEAGILAEHGELLRFRHDLIREALYLDRPAGIRAALHREAAHALSASGAPAHRVAEQFSLGARPGDREAVEAIHRGAVAERSAVTRIGLLERALALCREDDDAAVAIRADLAEALASAGRPTEADAIARALIEGMRGAVAARMRAVVAETLRLGGRWVELAGVVDGWLAQDALDETERTGLMATAAYAKGISVAFDSHEVERMGREALRRAEASGDKGTIVLALLGTLWGAIKNSADDALALAERAARLAETTPEDRILRLQPHWHLGRCRFDDLAAAEGAFRAGLRLAEELGRLADTPLYLDGLAHAHFLAGRWDDAVAEAEAAVAAAEETGTLMWVVGSRALLAHVAIYRGDLGAAEEHVRAEETLALSLGPGFDEAAQSHRSMLAEVRGDYRAALEPRWEKFLRDVGEGRWPSGWWRCLWLALETDEIDTARELVAHLERAADDDEGGGQAALARAMLDGDADGVAKNVDQTGGFSPDVRAERGALALARVGLAADAKQRFISCAAVLESAGARVWLDNLTRQLERHGLRMARRRRRAPPASGWAALTTTEQRVARLAAEGLTNPAIAARLFVSPRTVQTHLAHVFQKLGISSRVELAAEVARRRG